MHTELPIYKLQRPQKKSNIDFHSQFKNISETRATQNHVQIKGKNQIHFDTFNDLFFIDIEIDVI